MPRRKWCFGRRDVICMTADCRYMRDCIVKVAQDRAEEFIDAARANPRLKLPRIKRDLKRLERRRPKVGRTKA